MEEVIGFLIAILIGCIMGLLGGGGSVLAVPIFVYILNIEAVIATGYSLFVVGAAALVGAYRYFQQGLVNLKIALIFGAPSLVMVYLTRAHIVPALPDPFFSLDYFILTKNAAIVVFFAVVMLFSSTIMIRKGAKLQEQNPVPKAVSTKELNIPILILNATLVGLIAGLVGAGGGFLIVPSLVFLARIPMKEAIATSLCIIAINSLLGFLGDWQNHDIDWTFLLPFTGFTIIGILLGTHFCKYVPAGKLKKYFGYMVLLIAFFIIYREFIY
ncbi:putative permease [Bernardetia litoralis DSM 6794]|uniref:Probable membrane transporter protein n=1 Tax=Bernardetia litoralis (strain ATCC 23117 / DSM 6794 / NBRC 15988 / NCIMB 1366 / Fx l1 / Sio-4) TaxID=880071 RepID=I4AJ92_BERLS|nr:sulfite exporter TauE/SafE family protein [Bernardetia litoralis]AFM04027.1 putative permease [Bernardetia litoralis DSM 6794]